MDKNLTPQSNDIIFYSSPSGDVRVEVFFQEETIILIEVSVIRKFRTTETDGKNHFTNFYNLDAIIAFDYCLNVN